MKSTAIHGNLHIADDNLQSLSVENCTPTKISPLANLVIEVDSKVVELVNFGAGRDTNDDNSGEIRAIYILPEYWSQGLGKKLFLAAIEKLQEIKFDKVYLWVLKDNIRATDFYNKMNMVCTDYKKQSIFLAQIC